MSTAGGFYKRDGSLVTSEEVSAHFNGLTLIHPWVDVHIYWSPGRDDAAVTAVREGMSKEFTGRGQFQLYEPHKQPIGPHPVPMFEAHIDASMAGEVMQWIDASGQGMKALVHPHSADGGLADHTRHARWVGGEPLQLTTSIFKD